MFRTMMPANQIALGVGDLSHSLAGVRDGTEEAIHQTRVAIRRLRELLALTRAESGAKVIEDVEDRLRRAARSLGRVRDADIAQHLIQHLQERFMSAPVTLSKLRALVTAEQLRSRRKALKKLEALDLDAVPRLLSGAHNARSAWRGRRSEVTELLRAHMAERAQDVRAALAHAGGVYFPNRVHAARVAVKRLRYTLEAAVVMALWRGPEAIRRLKKTQDALGEAHDRQLLMARLQALISDKNILPISRISPFSIMRDEVDALRQYLLSEAVWYHAKFLRWRPEILEICHQSAAAAIPRMSLATRAVVVATVGVPSYLLWRKSNPRIIRAVTHHAQS